jgi:hypothetical protein
MNYKFKYAPQYSDLLYLGIFLIAGGTIALLQYPFLIPLIWVSVIGAFYFFIKRKPSIYFFENYIELRRGFGNKKKVTNINYSDVQLIQYCFAEVRGSHLFKVTFSKNINVGTIQYSFNGRPSKIEIIFFESKGLPIKVIPESAKYKLYKNIK